MPDGTGKFYNPDGQLEYEGDWEDGRPNHTDKKRTIEITFNDDNLTPHDIFYTYISSIVKERAYIVYFTREPNENADTIAKRFSILYNDKPYSTDKPLKIAVAGICENSKFSCFSNEYIALRENMVRANNNSAIGIMKSEEFSTYELNRLMKVSLMKSDREWIIAQCDSIRWCKNFANVKRFFTL